jgi:hypothetical protein
MFSFFFSHYQSALGFDADTKVEKHESTVSFSKGYGGKFGVQQTNDKVCILHVVLQQLTTTECPRLRR